jgi:hypothetical protein
MLRGDPLQDENSVLREVLEKTITEVRVDSLRWHHD